MTDQTMCNWLESDRSHRSHTVVAIAMTAAARLDFVTVFCGALHDAGDLLRVLWEGDGDGSHRTVQVVNMWHSQLGQGVALEDHEVWVVSDCREEAVVAGVALSIAHLERSARGLKGVVVLRIGSSTGEGREEKELR